MFFMLGCSGTTSVGPHPDGGSSDSGTGDGLQGGEQSAPCPQTACAVDRLCHQGRCVEDHGPCAKDDDCQDDTYCEAGHCIGYVETGKSHDPNCEQGAFKPEQLVAPQVKCKWDAQEVVTMPVVADLDGDAKPEILFIDITGHLVAISGQDCSERFNLTGAGLHWCSHLAVGDLDADGKPEIVAIDTLNRVVVLSNQGAVLATSEAAAGTGTYRCSGAAIANLDGQGNAEIVYEGMALRYEAGKLTTLYNVPAPLAGPYAVLLSAVADVDGDGTPELLTGNRILDGMTGVDKTPAAVAAFAAGWVAVADFDKTTPGPEIVLVSSQSATASVLRVYAPQTGAVVFGPYSFDTRYGGPPTVADFDGDGEPEIGVAGYSSYLVFDRECAVTPLPAHCVEPGIRWRKTTRDNSSSVTGSSVFDFNGDGRAEVVYRDECWLRVYDGKDGKALFAQTVNSGTGTEMPVIADVDGDGHAEIVVSSDGAAVGACPAEADLGLPVGPATKGVLVLQDPQDRWMPSRPIWNQHTYHITNVGDDGSIPLKETPNWQSYNNYRQNVQGKIDDKEPGLDLTARKHVGVDTASDCVQHWILLAELCNRGSRAAPAGLSGTFYRGDPRSGGTKICTATTTGELKAGSCETVQCDYAQPPKDPIDLWFVADDDGSGAGREAECKEANNLAHMPGISCPGISID